MLFRMSGQGRANLARWSSEEAGCSKDDRDEGCLRNRLVAAKGVDPDRRRYEVRQSHCYQRRSAEGEV